MRCKTAVIGALLCLGVGFVSAQVTPYFAIRSQSTNAAMELSGWEHQVNLFKTEPKTYGSLAITPAYFRSFKPERIAQDLFCDALINDCCDTTCPSIKIAGSLVEGRADNALLADYFGLSTDFESIVSFEPRIHNFMVDFNFYLGLERVLQGLYFRIHAPVVRSWWELNFCEHDRKSGEDPHWPGYFNPTLNGVYPNEYGISHANLLQSFEAYAVDGKAPNVTDVRWEPLAFAKLYKCRKIETKLSDLQMALGWNTWEKEDYHVGLALRAAAPTGTRPSGCYLFEPIVGNGHHWEVGVGLTSHWTMWRSVDEADEFGLYFDANVMHLFKTCQCRTFDLCGKPLSRYMLAAKFGPRVDDLNNHDDPLKKPTMQFAGVYTPLANLSTTKVDVSIDVQGDLALMAAYSHNNYTFDLGYGFYGRSREKICHRYDACCCAATQSFANNAWALKGDAFMYGFIADEGTGRLAGTGVALSASESGATIFKGTNNPPNGVGALQWYQNPGVDNPDYAYAGLDPLRTKPTGSTDDPEQLQTSYNPILLKENDFDFTGTRVLAHKIFTHFSYAWYEHQGWVPFLGFGGEVEFGHRDARCCQSTCTTACTASCGACSQSCGACENCYSRACKGRDVGLWQWGVWLKGGISFN